MENNREKYGRISSLVGIACNLLVATLKLLAGLSAGTVSVIADAVNNFSDAASSVVNLVGFRLASRPADDDHPFGHARYEYLSGLIVSFLVLLAGYELLKTSIGKLITPEPSEYSLPLFAALIFSILVKAGMALLNFRLGKKISSAAILAAAEDSRNDIIATAAVLLGALISRFTGHNLDGFIGLFVACFILYSGIQLIRSTSAPLLGEAPPEELVSSIEAKILSYPGVLGTHDLMVHDYGPGHCFASAHVEVPAEADVLQCHEMIDTIERDFMETEHILMVIHYDPIVTDDSLVGEIRAYLSARLLELDSRLSIHDLRIVPGEKNTNVIFDCVIPRTFSLTEAQLTQQIRSILHEQYPACSAVINYDHSFVASAH